MYTCDDELVELGSMCLLTIKAEVQTGRCQSPTTAIAKAKQRHGHKTGTGSGQALNNTTNIQAGEAESKC